MTSKTLDLEKRLLGQWNALVRRARIGRDYKAAAFIVSSYANPDGTGIRLSVARYAIDLEVSYSTARRYLTWLRKVGLLEMTRVGSRRRMTASEYRLILSPDILETLEVLTPTRQNELADEMLEANRSGVRDRAARAKELLQRSSSASAEVAEEDDESDTTGDLQRSPEQAQKEEFSAQIDDPQRSPWMTYTPSSTHLSVNERPSQTGDGDLRTAVTVARATPEEPPNPESSLRPKKCPDGLSPAMRPDGKPECPICRRRLLRPGIEIPAPPEDRIAPVIDLRTREVS